MARMLTALIALGTLGFLAYYAYGRQPAVGPSEPKQRLDNVRAKARAIEANDQQYINEMEKKTEP